MKTKSILSGTSCAFIFMFTAKSADAQNLVPNPGFEVQDSCPIVSEIYVAPPWESATLGTPDLFDSECPVQNISAHTGSGSAGVFLLTTFDDNREYMEAPLLEPLENGKIYDVSYWVKHTGFRYAVNHFGAYFSTDEINETSTGVLEFTPQVDNDASNMLDESSWTEISGSFVADGGESYIIFGNFYDDAGTDTAVVNSGSTSYVAFYQIDDISVTKSDDVAISDLYTKNAIHIFPQPATDHAEIAISGRLNAESLVLYDGAGNRIKDIATGALEGTYMLDVTEYPAGIYIICAETASGPVTKKLQIL